MSEQRGRRPDLSIRVKRKDDGATEYPLSGWKNDGMRGIQLRLAEGWTLVSPDGESYTTGKDGNCYLDAFRNDGDRKASRPRPAPKEPREESGGGDFDDIPFSPLGDVG